MGYISNWRKTLRRLERDGCGGVYGGGEDVECDGRPYADGVVDGSNGGVELGAVGENFLP